MRTRRLPHDDDGCGWIAQLPPLPPAQKPTASERADCAVIGAGFTGLAAARRLATHRPDWRIVVVEAQRVGFGASGRNSGFVVDVPHYAPALGPEGNRRLVRINRAGLDCLRDVVRAHRIDCDWTEGGRVHGAADDAGLHGLETFLAGLEAMGEPFESLSAAALTRIIGSSYYRAGARTPGTVTIQPAALVRGLAASLPPNVTLFEESPVRALRLGGSCALTVGDTEIIADRLVLAANGFTPALGLLRRRVFPLYTFASLTRVLSTAEQAALGGETVWGLVSEERMGTTVRRTPDQRILIRNSVRYEPRLRLGANVLSAMRDVHRCSFRDRFPMLPEVDLESTWSGVMGITMNGASFFGRLHDNVFAAAGCNGVGIALGTTAGTLLADLAVGADSDLLNDMPALPTPSWIPPEPLLGVGVRATLARLQARAGKDF